MDRVFITGQYRSGTTLTEKILSNNPNIKIASQPFPYLYFELKNKFYKKLGISRRYPLSDLFGEKDYTNQEFCTYLKDTKLSSKEVENLLFDMEGYFGNWSPQLKKNYNKIYGGELRHIYFSLTKAYIDLFEDSSTKVIGSKEILAEEYIPYFLNNNIKVIHVIRDPRDLIVSLNFGKGEYFTGGKRPVLYSIRGWRKSVAFAIQCQNHPYYTLIRYEDLVLNFSDTMTKCMHFLNIENHFDSDSIIIKDQFGKEWSSNSSFQNTSVINKDAVNKFTKFLDKETISYIEKTCQFELQYLNYKLTNISDQLKDYDLYSYVEPFKINRNDFEQSYSTDKDTLDLEVRRLDFLSRKLKIEDQVKRQFFIFPRVYEVLNAFNESR